MRIDASINSEQLFYCACNAAADAQNPGREIQSRNSLKPGLVSVCIPPHPIHEGEPRHPSEEAHLCRSYSQSHSFRRYPQLIATGERVNINRQLHRLAELSSPQQTVTTSTSLHLPVDPPNAGRIVKPLVQSVLSGGQRQRMGL